MVFDVIVLARQEMNSVDHPIHTYVKRLGEILPPFRFQNDMIEFTCLVVIFEHK